MDSHPPNKPVVDPLPEKVSDTTTTITGTADPGTTIEIEHDGQVYTQEVGTDGTFEIEVELSSKTTNDLSVEAVDAVGNRSGAQSLTVTFTREASMIRLAIEVNTTYNIKRLVMVAM